MAVLCSEVSLGCFGNQINSLCCSELGLPIMKSGKWSNMLQKYTQNEYHDYSWRNQRFKVHRTDALAHRSSLICLFWRYGSLNITINQTGIQDSNLKPWCRKLWFAASAMSIFSSNLCHHTEKTWGKKGGGKGNIKEYFDWIIDYQDLCMCRG